jgi:arylformamidase
VLAASLLLALPLANAGLRDRLAQRRAGAPTVALAQVLHDVAYGSDPRQRFDVYVPTRRPRCAGDVTDDVRDA